MRSGATGFEPANAIAFSSIAASGTTPEAGCISCVRLYIPPRARNWLDVRLGCHFLDRLALMAAPCARALIGGVVTRLPLWDKGRGAWPALKRLK